MKLYFLFNLTDMKTSMSYKEIMYMKFRAPYLNNFTVCLMARMIRRGGKESNI